MVYGDIEELIRVHVVDPTVPIASQSAAWVISSDA
jgi:hypothetical protein